MWPRRPNGEDDWHQVRKRLDSTLRRLRDRLEAQGLRGTLIHANSGQINIDLGTDDTVVFED